MAREYTSRLLELVEEGMFDKDLLIEALANWMSENDVRELVQAEGWVGFFDEEEEEEFA